MGNQKNVSRKNKRADGQYQGGKSSAKKHAMIVNGLKQKMAHILWVYREKRCKKFTLRRCRKEVDEGKMGGGLPDRKKGATDADILNYWVTELSFLEDLYKVKDDVPPVVDDSEPADQSDHNLVIDEADQSDHNLVIDEENVSGSPGGGCSGVCKGWGEGS